MAALGPSRRERLLVATAAALVFSRVFGLSLALPHFADHYTARLAVDPFWIGVAFGAHGLTMAAMQLPLGRLGDRIGRWPVLAGGTAMFIAGSVWAAFASSITTLVAARLLMGAGAITSTALAAVGETVPDGRRTTAMAFIGIPAGAAFMAGTAAASFLYPVVSMQGIFLTTAAVALVAALPLAWLRFPAPHPLPRRLVLDRPAGALAAAGFAKNGMLMAALFLLPDARPQVLLPMLLPALLAVGLVGRLADRGAWTWQHLAVALAAGALTLPAFAPGSGWLLAGGMVFFASHAVLAAGLPSQVSRISGAAGGTGHGVQNVVSFLGTFVGGAMAGVAVGAGKTTWLFAAMALLGLATVGALARHLPPAAPPVPQSS